MNSTQPAAGFGAMTVDAFLAATAAKSPTPGGGAVASVVGALGASLAGMVVAYSAGKKGLAAHEVELREALARLSRAAGVLMKLAEEDAAAYGLVNELSKLAEGDARRAELPGAVVAAVQIPMSVSAAAVDVLRLCERLAGTTNRHLRSDLAIAAILAESAARTSHWNVMVNAPSLADPAEQGRMLKMSGDLVEEAKARCARVCAACEA